MRFTTASAAAALVAVQPAAANFLIFDIINNQAPDPTTSQSVLLYNNPPACDSPGFMSDANFYNDASRGGFACDGCDISKAMPDWDITRFEFNDNDATVLAGPGQPIHFSTISRHIDKYSATYTNCLIALYQDGTNKAQYGMYDVNMNSLGSCERPADPQYFQCSAGLSVGSGYAIFSCKTKARRNFTSVQTFDERRHHRNHNYELQLEREIRGP